MELSMEYSMEYSMGLFVYYFGSKKQYKDVAHHTIYFGNSYEKHLNKIFEKKILSEDISYYLHRPSATDPNMAPSGQDAFYVLVPVPNNLSNINWLNEGEKFKDLILDKMDKSDVTFKQFVIAEDLLELCDGEVQDNFNIYIKNNLTNIDKNRLSKISKNIIADNFSILQDNKVKTNIITGI